MGRDKAAIPFGGVPLAVRTARQLAGVCEDVLLVGGAAPEGAPGRGVPDPEGPRCALRGLVGALEAARAERVLVVATDMPYLTPDLLLALLAFPPADAVVPRRGGRPHPLCAVYRRDPVLAPARERLARGDLRLRDLLEAVGTHYLEGADLEAVDPGGRALDNVNTEADLAASKSG